MRRRRWVGWRLAIAAVLTGALILLVGVVLRLEGLSAAANVAQVASLVPLIGGWIGWARGSQAVQDPDVEYRGDLGEMLRTIADTKGLTGEDIRAQMKGYDPHTVDSYLDGIQQPDWDFIAAFLKIAAPDNAWQREILERRIRSAWNASNSRLQTGNTGKKLSSSKDTPRSTPRISNLISGLRGFAKMWRQISSIVLSTLWRQPRMPPAAEHGSVADDRTTQQTLSNRPRTLIIIGTFTATVAAVITLVQLYGIPELNSAPHYVPYSAPHYTPSATSPVTSQTPVDLVACRCWCPGL